MAGKQDAPEDVRMVVADVDAWNQYTWGRNRHPMLQESERLAERKSSEGINKTV